MLTAGIVAEYNPFHRGHKYHIEETRKRTEADCIVVVMSGNFVQRGEPALYNKWIRAEAAVRGGADLVLELPVVYSCSGAEMFAKGAVEILESLNAVDWISFGAEECSESVLKEAAEIFAMESTGLSEAIKESLKQGYSYAAARSRAAKQTYGERIAELISAPNNILAVEYLKQLKLSSSKIKPIVIERRAAGYYAENTEQGFAGAGRLREMLRDGFDLEEILCYLPKETHALYKNEHLCFPDDIYQLAAYKLLTETSEKLSEIDGVFEGLENRAKKALAESIDYESLIAGIKSKRYSRTSIQRMIVRMVLGIKSEDMKKFADVGEAYGRVLAFNKTGASLIRKIKKQDNPRIKIITNINREQPENELLRKMLSYDVLASEIYDLICFSRVNVNSEYRMKPYMG